jgi:hypothetical protein
MSEAAVGGETVVMTATFRAETTPYLVIREESERILQYMSALVSWARPKSARRIVLGENSNTRFDFGKVARYLEAAGKEVEVLVFDGNRSVEQRGKGFGEGEILEYIFTNSALARRADTFYKVTGRLFVSNFDVITEATQDSNAFHRTHGKLGRPSKVNTTFFKCSRVLFETRLLHAYADVDELNRVYIEHVYFNQLRGAEVADFAVPPVLIGQQASTGKIYTAYDPDVVETAKSLM